MCGVGFIYSKKGFPIQEIALDEFVKPLERRGPDKVLISHVKNKYCMVNSILSIKKTLPYHDSSKGACGASPNDLDPLFSFNGEIYDWDSCRFT